jgi:hypothetical protein
MYSYRFLIRVPTVFPAMYYEIHDRCHSKGVAGKPERTARQRE